MQSEDSTVDEVENRPHLSNRHLAMEAMASLGGQRGGLMMLTENRINTTIQRLAVEGINNNTMEEVKNKPFIPLLNLTQLQWIKAD